MKIGKIKNPGEKPKIPELPKATAPAAAGEETQGGSRRPHWTTFARGKRRKRGTMNGTEKAYSEFLDNRLWMKEILWYRFEGLSFRLADGARYTPDFVVLLCSGFIECIEVKGFWAEAAKVRIKVAAEQYPFRFVAVTKKPRKDGGGWKEEDF